MSGALLLVMPTTLNASVTLKGSVNKEKVNLGRQVNPTWSVYEGKS